MKTESSEFTLCPNIPIFHSQWAKEKTSTETELGNFFFPSQRDIWKDLKCGGSTLDCVVCDVLYSSG